MGPRGTRYLERSGGGFQSQDRSLGAPFSGGFPWREGQGEGSLLGRRSSGNMGGHESNFKRGGTKTENRSAFFLPSSPGSVAGSASRGSGRPRAKNAAGNRDQRTPTECRSGFGSVGRTPGTGRSDPSPGYVGRTAPGSKHGSFSGGWEVRTGLLGWEEGTPNRRLPDRGTEL